MPLSSAVFSKSWYGYLAEHWLLFAAIGYWCYINSLKILSCAVKWERSEINKNMFNASTNATLFSKVCWIFLQTALHQLIHCYKLHLVQIYLHTEIYLLFLIITFKKSKWKVISIQLSIHGVEIVQTSMLKCEQNNFTTYLGWKFIPTGDLKLKLELKSYIGFHFFYSGCKKTNV